MIMKKRIGAITLAMVLCFSATACSSGVKEEVHESVKTELSDLQSDYTALEKEKKSVESDLKSIKAEYESYKEKMEPYEAIEKADAEARLKEIEESKAAEAEEKARQESIEA